MILNTRNFLLYLLTVAILVVAIATTATTRSTTDRASEYEIIPTPTEISNEATVISAITLDRNGRLAAMKEKVAALIMTDSEAQDESIVESLPVEPIVATSTVVTMSRNELRCDTYLPFAGSWQANGLTFSVVEGARLVSRVTPQGEGTILQLPLRSYPVAEKSCLPTDVVAIALDGSLIRNSEIALYSLFTEETLLGYTIDGFPLFGVTPRPTDECGGAMVAGQYQYYLKPGTDHILSCFSGIPVEL